MACALLLRGRPLFAQAGGPSCQCSGDLQVTDIDSVNCERSVPAADQLQCEEHFKHFCFQASTNLVDCNDTLKPGQQQRQTCKDVGGLCQHTFTYSWSVKVTKGTGTPTTGSASDTIFQICVPKSVKQVEVCLTLALACKCVAGTTVYPGMGCTSKEKCQKFNV